MTITGASGQSANLLTVEDSSSNAFVEIQSNGSIRLGTSSTRKIWVANMSGTHPAGKHLELRAGQAPGPGAGPAHGHRPWTLPLAKVHGL